jgi:signal transduction histidine kinase
MTDVTEQQRAEDAIRRQAAFVKLSREVAVTANEAGDVREAIETVLRLVCEHTAWPVGHAVLLPNVRGRTDTVDLWHVDDPERFGVVRAAAATPVQRGIGILGEVWETGRPVWTVDGRDEPGAALAAGLRTALACPILVGSTVVGVFEFFSTRRVRPGDDFVEVMMGIGAQLGRVIERADAEEHLREYAERLTTLSRRLIEAQESERRVVSRELHDEIGQAFTALKLNLQALIAGIDPEATRVTLEESLGLADQALRQARDLSLDLRPALLDDLGLVPALRWYLDRQGKRAGFATEFAASDVGNEVPAEVATTCFRIAQEALTNVARHAAATKVTMELSRRGTVLELVVRDCGRGFDAARASLGAAGGESLGLLGMRERAALVGGSLTIDSTPGSGTEVRVQLPVPE